MPYGSTTGTRKYSALIYPVVGTHTATVTAYDTTSGITFDVANTDGTQITFVSGDVINEHVLAFELTLKDSNDNLSFVSAAVTGLTGEIGDTFGGGTYQLSALDGATSNYGNLNDTKADTFLESITGKTLVHGQLRSTGYNNAKGMNASLSASDYYIIGSPTLINLTEGQYNIDCHLYESGFD